MRKDDMTPEVRIDRNLLRICNAAGVSITHYTEESWRSCVRKCAAS